MLASPFSSSRSKLRVYLKCETCSPNEGLRCKNLSYSLNYVAGNSNNVVCFIKFSIPRQNKKNLKNQVRDIFLNSTFGPKTYLPGIICSVWWLATLAISQALIINLDFWIKNIWPRWYVDCSQFFQFSRHAHE